MTGGPLVAKGKVMEGTRGARRAAITSWRWTPIRARKPGAFTPSRGRASRAATAGTGCRSNNAMAASVWTAGSYDPALNLVYFGIAQTYDTGPLLHPVNKPGITNEGLYTDSTVAINPDTGKLAWHFQHMPNDQWDLDWAFERQLIRLPVNGATENGRRSRRASRRSTMCWTPQTGKYIFSMDLGLQNS